MVIYRSPPLAQGWAFQYTIDARHEKTDYKIALCCLQRLYSVVVVIPKEGLAGPQPTNPS